MADEKWKFISVAELMAQLHLMSACAGGMSGPAVLQWVIRTVEGMAGKDDSENRPRCQGFDAERSEKRHEVDGTAEGW